MIIFIVLLVGVNLLNILFIFNLGINIDIGVVIVEFLFFKVIRLFIFFGIIFGIGKVIFLEVMYVFFKLICILFIRIELIVFSFVFCIMMYCVRLVWLMFCLWLSMVDIFVIVKGVYFILLFLYDVKSL